MPRLPLFKPRMVEKILLKNGFFVKRQTGSHRVYHNPETEKVVVVPFHSREVARGTLRNIVRQSNLPDKAFRKRK